MSTIKRILVGMLATVAECTWQVVIQKINISPCTAAALPGIIPQAMAEEYTRPAITLASTAAVLPEIAQREMVELFMLLVP